jgi:hypothetical protein
LSRKNYTEIDAIVSYWDIYLNNEFLVWVIKV